MQLNAEHRISFYLIRMCIQDRIEDCAWDGRTQLEIGGRKTDDHILPMGNDTLFHLTFTLHEDRPAVICQDGSSKKLIEPYDGLWIVPSSLADIAVGVFLAPEEAVLTFSLQPETERMIGRSASTDIRLSHRSVSKSHAVIARSTRYEIFDMQSSMGTYVNGRRVQRQELKAGDEITIGIYHILFDGAGLHATPYLLASQNPADPFQRSPRCITQIPQRQLQLEKPPAIMNTPKINWMSVMIMPVISLALMATLSIVMGMSSYMLAASGCMSVVSALGAVFTYRSQKKAHKKRTALIEEKYHAYLADISSQLNRAHQNQREVMQTTNPPFADQLATVVNRSPHLWERTPMDADFGMVRVGTGEVQAACYAVYQQPQFVLEESPLEQEARKIAENSGMLSDMPILCPLIFEGLIGMVGGQKPEANLLRSMLTALATSHAPGELKIVLLVQPDALSQWSWARWLPHLRGEDGQTSLFCADNAAAEKLLTSLEEMLQVRQAVQKQSGNPTVPENLPHYVFVSTAYGWLEQHAIAKLLFSEPRPGCSALFAYPNLSLLPKECRQILEVGQEEARLYSKQNISQSTALHPDGISAEQAEKLARSMAGIPVEYGAEAATLPTSVSFFEGLGVQNPQELKIGERWKKARPYKSLRVPIAARAGGGTFYFDIHEKFHGVNGVVAGMPRSGKTEMVQTWLLSMAVHFSPQDVSFILVDFKGTGMIAPFRMLPHLAGTISNLDTSIQRNLIALQNEVHRREALLDRYPHVLNKPEINYLNEAYAQGLVPEKLPVLLIVIDEYAEFKKEFPEFGAEIDSLTSKGGGLGIFVILMTQKPAGVVSSRSEDNIRFRWCLRVANFAASREMLGRPDAANIHTPGRAFVKVGENDVFEEVQSFWSGAPYTPNREKADGEIPQIYRVSQTGARTPCFQTEKDEKSTAHIAQNKAIVSYIADYCRINHIPPAEKIWMERLPERLAVETLLEAQFNGSEWPAQPVQPGLGLLDDPYHQRQLPLTLNWEKNGHVLIYGAPQTGKTTLLKTLLVSLALTRKPDAVSIYVMDFGGWNLNLFRAMPHVGGIANEQDPERLRKLTMLLRDILAERKAAFAKAGVGNIRAYREVTKQDIPDVLLVVDHIAAALKLFPDLDGFFSDYTSSGANYGLYLAATAAASNAVPMKISQNIKYSLTLQMLDKSDYTYLVGKVPAPLPAIMGRGYAKGMPPLEFQTALPVDGSDQEVTAYIEHLAQQMTAAWHGRRPAPIPILPEVIPYGSVSCDGLCLGLSTERVQPVCYDWKKQHFLLISGTEQSGKSNMLQNLAWQFAEKMHGKIIAMDIKGSGLQALHSIADVFCTDAAAMDSCLADLRPELRERQRLQQTDAAAHFQPLGLFIDDFAAFYQAINDDSAMLLLSIIKLGAGQDVYLIAAGSADGLSTLINQGQVIALWMSKNKMALALGGCLNDHGIAPTKIPYSVREAPLGKYGGAVIKDDSYTQFRAMKRKEEENHA